MLVAMTSQRSLALQNAQARIRQRVEQQMALVSSYLASVSQIEAAERRLAAVHDECRTKVEAAEQVVAQRQRARLAALADLASVVNDDDETAEVIGVSVKQVKAARRAAAVDHAAPPPEPPPEPVPAPAQKRTAKSPPARRPSAGNGSKAK